jgi:hypothetical protein
MASSFASNTDALKRWSCGEESAPLPPVDRIREVHIYDFDNTLFKTPVPSRKLWYASCIGRFMNPHCFHGGGWWHDPSILAATGDGVELEEPRAWGKWWNEKVVELSRMSIAQPDALSVLLTGRGGPRFADLVRRIIKSKGLEFDMTCLKPDVQSRPFKSTMDFKQNLIRAVLQTYSSAEKLTIYEDRPKHVHQFRSFLEDVARELAYHDSLPRQLQFNVVQVPESDSSLDPATEAREIQRMINEHNDAIMTGAAHEKACPMTLKKLVFMIFYSIQTSDYKRLLALVPGLNSQAQSSGRIVIATGSISDDEIAGLGGVGNAILFRATDIGTVDGEIIAVRVEPVDKAIKVRPRTTPHPTVILSLRRDSRPTVVRDIRHWKSLPPDKQLEFRATLREHYRLDITNVSNDPNGRRAGENDAPHGGYSTQKGDFSKQAAKPSGASPERSTYYDHPHNARGGAPGNHHHDGRQWNAPHSNYQPRHYHQQYNARGGIPTRPAAASRGSYHHPRDSPHRSLHHHHHHHHLAANGGARGYSAQARGRGGGGDRGGVGARGGGRVGTPRGGMGRGGRGGGPGGYARGGGRGGYRSLDDVGGAYTGPRKERNGDMYNDY